MDELSLTGLRVVREVAARGSFTGAAEALDYTQSAVSRQVAAIEAATGVALFERQARGVRPTPAGRALLRHADAILERVEVASQELAGLRDRLEGRLRIGVFPTALAVLVPRALAVLRERHPALVVDVQEAGTPVLLRRLRAGGLELATIAVGDGLQAYDLSGLRETVLVRQAGLLLAVSAGHRLAGRRAVDASELERETWIAGRGEAPQFRVWPGLEGTAHVGFAVREWPSRLGLVAAGLGVAVVPEIMRDALPPGVAVVAVNARTTTLRDVLAVTRADPSQATVALVEALQAEGAKVPSAALSRTG